MVIKYRYALDSVNSVIDITQLNREKTTNKELYKCLGCDKILIPILGQKRQKHFRHKIDLDCSPETYLHKLAKQKFFEVYNNCLLEKLPFFIRLNQEVECNYFQNSFSFNCQLSDKLVTYDLTKYFHQIYLESREDSFIPDLLLVSKTGEKIFIEIAVTHFSSERKLNSGYRLIEIDINSEDDIEVINRRKLVQNEQVNFINFNPKIIKNSCRGKCYLNLRPYSYCVTEYGYLEYDYFVVF